MKKADTGRGALTGPMADARRRSVLRGMLALGGALALGGCATATQPGAGTGGSARLVGGRFSVRWLGGGVVALAGSIWALVTFYSPDDAARRPSNVTVEAPGGVAAGGDISGSTITVQPLQPDVPGGTAPGGGK